MAVRQIWSLVKESVAAWIEDYAPSMGAALAYYTLFSIAPLLASMRLNESYVAFSRGRICNRSNSPKAAGVRLTINFEQRAIVIESPKYNMAIVYVRALGKDFLARLAAGEVVQKDILATRWCGSGLH